MPKHDEDLECIGEKKRQIAGVSVHCNGRRKKHNYQLAFLTFSPQAFPLAA
jgi:hypothetical protein